MRPYGNYYPFTIKSDNISGSGGTNAFLDIRAITANNLRIYDLISATYWNETGKSWGALVDNPINWNSDIFVTVKYDYGLTWITIGNSTNSSVINTTISSSAMVGRSATYFIFGDWVTNDGFGTTTFWNISSRVSLGNLTSTDISCGKGNCSNVRISLSSMPAGTEFTACIHSNSTWATKDCRNITIAGNTTFAIVNATTGTNRLEGVFRTSNSAFTPVLDSWIVELFDIIPPVISFVAPTELNNTFLSRDYIAVNVSVNETNEANITFYLYNSTNTMNATNMSAGTRFINFTNLSSGQYWYNVTVWDLSGNQNTTEKRKITLDTIPPYVNLTLPANGTSSTATSFNLTYDLLDVNLNYCELYDDYPSGAFQFAMNKSSVSAGVNNFIRNYGVGSWSWNVLCLDKSGNSNFSASNFTLTVEPTIIVSTPGGGGTVIFQNITILNETIETLWRKIDQYYFYPLISREFVANITTNLPVKSCESEKFNCNFSGTEIMIGYVIGHENEIYSEISDRIRVSDGYSYAYLPITLRIVNLYAYAPINPISVYRTDITQYLDFFFQYDGDSIVGIRWWWISMILLFAVVKYFVPQKQKVAFVRLVES